MGFKVGITLQPDWKTWTASRFWAPLTGLSGDGRQYGPHGEPLYVAKRRRSYDYFSPGKMGLRPDYATTVYCNLIRRSYRHIPIIIGGIEASSVALPTMTTGRTS